MIKYLLFVTLIFISFTSCKQKNTEATPKENTVSEIEIHPETKTISKKDSILQSFSNEDILKTVNFYEESYRKNNHDYNVIPKDLKLKLSALGLRVCETKNEELFDAFLKMLLASKGFKSDMPSSILNQIYLCEPELMIDYLTNKYPDKRLAGLLQYGFESMAIQLEVQMDNFNELMSGIYRLLN